DVCILQHRADGGPGAVRVVFMGGVHLHLEGTLPGALDHLGGQVHITGHHRIHHLLDLIQVGSGIDQGSQQHVSGNTGARINPQAHAVKDTTRCSTGWPVLREAGTSISIWLLLPANAGGLASSRSSRMNWPSTSTSR